MAGTVRVVGFTRPAGQGRVDRALPSGQTVEELLDQAGFTSRERLRVTLGGTRLDPRYWPHVRPHAGQELTARIVPRDPVTIGVILSQVATAIAAVVPGAATIGATIGGTGFAVGLAGGAVGTAIAAGTIIAGVTLVGAGIGLSLAARSLISSPGEQEIRRTQGGRLFGITNTANVSDPFGPVPKVFGERRVYPKNAARQYTEVAGASQYLRALFAISDGPTEISEIRIGDTPIENFSDVEYQIREGGPDETEAISVYRTALQQSLSVSFPVRKFNESDFSAWTTRTTEPDAEEIGVDLSFPEGILRLSETGGRNAFAFKIEIQYREVGSGTWLHAVNATNFRGANGNASKSGTDIRIQGGRESPFLKGFVWDVAKGQYEVRIRRHETAATNARPGGADTSQVRGAFVWIALKAFTDNAPVNLATLATLAIRIRATDQVTGQLDQVSVLAKSKLRAYDPDDPEADADGLTPYRATRLAAWAYLEGLIGTQQRTPAPVAAIDLEKLATWAETGRTFDYIAGESGTHRTDELLDLIASAGRGSRDFVDGKISVQFDEPSEPVQMFNEENSWGFKGAKPWDDPPHALRIPFFNRDNDYAPDERVVYADGYSVDGSGGTQVASRIQTVEIPGLTDPEDIWREGRIRLAIAQLRPEIHEWQADFEAVRCRRGDTVEFSHQGILVGATGGNGRLRFVTPDGGGNIILMAAEGVLPYLQGSQYAVKIRKADGTFLLVNVTNPADAIGEDNENAAITPETAIPAAQAPAAGDLFTFGLRGKVTVREKIKAIRPNGDLSTTIEAFDEAPGIQEADQGTIPAFDSRVTSPQPLIHAVPLAPAIVAVISDEAAMDFTATGNLIPRILLLVRPAQGHTPADRLQARFRGVDPETEWSDVVDRPITDERIALAGVVEGETYDVQVRAASARLGTASGWTTVLAHTVVGRATVPPNVSSLRLEQSERLAWELTAPPIDLAGYRVRMHIGENRDWASATPLHAGLVTETKYPVGDLGAGTRTFLVKAVDSIGQESAAAATLVRNLGDLGIRNIVDTEDHHADGFTSGDITDGSVNGGTGDLEADTEPTSFWSDDNNAFWSASDAATFWQQTRYKAMAYQWNLPIDNADVPGTLRVDLEAAGESVTLEYSEDPAFWTGDGNDFWASDDDALFWGENFDFVPFPGVITIDDGTGLIFRLSTAAGEVRGVISALATELDVPDVVERFEDVAISSGGGTRLSITKTYREIVQVRFTVQDDGGDAVTGRLVDKQKTVGSGPLIELLDASGSGVAGQIDAEVRGY